MIQISKNELKDSGAEIKPALKNDDPIKKFFVSIGLFQ